MHKIVTWFDYEFYKGDRHFYKIWIKFKKIWINE